MMENNDDILLQQFFDSHRLDVPDNGFSRRVMAQIEGRKSRINRLWAAVCGVAAVAWIYASHFWVGLRQQIEGWLDALRTRVLTFLVEMLDFHTLLTTVGTLLLMGFSIWLVFLFLAYNYKEETDYARSS